MRPQPLRADFNPVSTYSVGNASLLVAHMKEETGPKGKDFFTFFGMDIADQNNLAPRG